MYGMRWLVISNELNVSMTVFHIHEVVSHFVDGNIWNVLVKCAYNAVNLDVYFGFILLWQPDM
jgi:hypothetical protein